MSVYLKVPKAALAVQSMRGESPPLPMLSSPADAETASVPVMWRPNRNPGMKTFENEWILETFEDHPSFFTKRMFGGLAVFLFGRQMMVLVEPAKTGRWKWHGVLICTEHALQPGIIEEFPQLAPHGVLKKWLYIDSRHEEFEPTMERVAEAIARDDKRFGILPQPREERVGSQSRRPKR